MDCKKNHFRQILLFLFFKGISAAEATKQLKKVYGDKALKERQCRNWFARFRLGDYSLKDEPHTGRPFEVGDEEIKAIIDANPYISIRELGDRLQVHFSTIDRHLHKLGYIKQQNIWIQTESASLKSSKHFPLPHQRYAVDSSRGDPLQELDPVRRHLSCEVASLKDVTFKNKDLHRSERINRNNYGHITKTTAKVRRLRRK